MSEEYTRKDMYGWGAVTDENLYMEIAQGMSFKELEKEAERLGDLLCFVGWQWILI